MIHCWKSLPRFDTRCVVHRRSLRTHRYKCDVQEAMSDKRSYPAHHLFLPMIYVPRTVYASAVLVRRTLLRWQPTCRPRSDVQQKVPHRYALHDVVQHVVRKSQPATLLLPCARCTPVRNGRRTSSHRLHISVPCRLGCCVPAKPTTVTMSFNRSSLEQDNGLHDTGVLSCQRDVQNTLGICIKL